MKSRVHPKPKSRPRALRSQIVRGLLFAMIPVGLMAWVSFNFNTPDFALTMPSDEDFRPVEPEEVFRLLSNVQIRVESPEGLEVSDQWRPVGGGDAFHKAVRVVWIRRGAMGVRFSSKGCGGGQALINGVLTDGPIFQIQKTGEMVRIEREEPPMLAEHTTDQRNR